MLETINVTSVMSHGAIIWKRRAHVQLLQETLVQGDAKANIKQQAKKHRNMFEPGPLDPEMNKAVAGIGIAASEGLKPYKLTNTTKDFRDAEATGRVAIYCVDLNGQTLVCAVVYGWTGATRGSVEAARTDDIIAIVRAQFLLLDQGPKLIAADLNGSTDAFPSLQGMLKEQGWHDVGMAGDKCEGRPAQPT